MSKIVALITGGNRGLGFATARKLAERGCRVIITARKRSEGEAAAERLRALVSGAEVQALTLDLASFASIRACAASFNALALPLHLLVNNAGLLSTEKNPAFTAEGYELTFGTNHIGHFLLTHLLLDSLVRSAPSRVVVVTSGMHKAGVGPGPGPDFDVDNVKAEKGFDPSVAYRNSKLANLWFAFELARRTKEKGVSVIAVSPGWVPETQADAQKSAFQRFLFRSVLPRLPIARTVEQGASNTAMAALEDGIKTGTYYEDMRPGELSDDARSDERAAKAWAASLRWCGIDRFEHWS